MDSSGIVAYKSRTQIVRYMIVTSFTLMILDWGLCFGNEVGLIWKSKWTGTKILYLITRYITFIEMALTAVSFFSPHITPEQCFPVYTTATWLSYAGVAIAELIIIWRTYAIWGQSQRILLVIGFFWLTFVVSNLYILSAFTKSLDFGPPPHPGVLGCYLLDANKIVFGSIVALLLLEIVVVGLTIAKAIGQIFSTSNPVVWTLYRDGVGFFFVLLLFSLGDLLVFALAPVELLDLLHILARVMYSIIGCRIVLHLREAAHSPYYVETNLSSLFSALNFKARPRLQRVAIPLAEDIEMTTTSHSM